MNVAPTWSLVDRWLEEMGVSYHNRKKIGLRGRVPYKYHHDLIERARSAGYVIQPEQLSNLANLANQ